MGWLVVNAGAGRGGGGDDDGGFEGRRASDGGSCGLPAQQIDGGEGEEGCSSKAKEQKWERNGMGMVKECRICQEEGDETDMEVPCACSGTLKYAHRKCIQKWCNKKGDITCELCNQVYAPNYSIPLARGNSDGFAVDTRQGWDHQIDIHDHHFFAVASAESELLGSEYDDYSTAHNNGIACCRSVALLLMLLLLIRHAVIVARDSAVAEDTSTFFNGSIFQFASILLVCYVIVRSCYIAQCRQRRQANLRQVRG